MTGKPLTIRKATEEDVNAFMLIEKQGYGDWKREFFLSEFDNSFSLVIAALKGEEIAGFAVVWDIGDEIQLNNIGVAPDFRREGIASALLDFITGYVWKDKPSRIILEVREKNTGARSFYHHHGFVVTGKRPDYYGDDNAILMEKNLNEI